MVSYDLSQPQRNYAKLKAFLRSHGYYAHVLESVWYVKSGLTAYALAQEILEYVDSDDHFVVSPVAGGSAWYNLDPEVSDWLKSASAA
jgi:hypothetical protein